MVVTSVLSLVGIGFVLALLLVAASLAFKVEEDPRVEALLDVLPGANCGGCGFAGCEGYAIAVIKDEKISANLCTVGGPDVAEKVGTISGKMVVATEPMVCFRHCSRNEGNVALRFEYVGARTCAAAAALEEGPYTCSSACLGLGDCVRSCNFDALYIQDGMVEVLGDKCVACGSCIKTCPRELLQLVPRRARILNPCATKEKLKAVSDVCSVGCFNCQKCLKACPAHALSHTTGRIEINHIACLTYGDACGEACVPACPRGILRSTNPNPPSAEQTQQAQKVIADRQNASAAKQEKAAAAQEEPPVAG